MRPLAAAGYISLTVVLIAAALILIEKGERDATEAQRNADQRVVRDIERAIEDEANAVFPDPCHADRILRDAARGNAGSNPADPDGGECGDLHQHGTVDAGSRQKPVD